MPATPIAPLSPSPFPANEQFVPADVPTPPPSRPGSPPPTPQSQNQRGRRISASLHDAFATQAIHGDTHPGIKGRIDAFINKLRGDAGRTDSKVVAGIDTFLGKLGGGFGQRIGNINGPLIDSAMEEVGTAHRERAEAESEQREKQAALPSAPIDKLNTMHKELELLNAIPKENISLTDLRRQNTLNSGISEFIEILRDTVQANSGTAANRENFDAAFKGVNDGSEPLTRDFIEKIDAIFKDGGGDFGKTFANKINGGLIDKALGQVRAAHQERAVAESEKQAEATRGPLGKLRAMQKELELLDAMPADQLTATHEARKHILTAGIGEFIKNLITALQAYSQTAEKGRKAALQLLT